MNDTQQNFAIDYPIAHPLKIIACPGSGKTFVLIKRLRRILSEIPTEFGKKILVMTFSRNCALEIQKRLSLESHPTSQYTQISTYHSLSYHIIRENLIEAGLHACPSVITTRQSINMINTLINNMEKSIAFNKEKGAKHAKILLELFNYAKSTGNPIQYLQTLQLQRQSLPLKYTFDLYQKKLKEGNLVDYNDLILLATKLLIDHPLILNRYLCLYPYLMIDEYQDISRAQFQLMSILGLHGRVTVVGDENQVIYGFQGAKSEHFMLFDSYFSGLVSNPRKCSSTQHNLPMHSNPQTFVATQYTPMQPQWQSNVKPNPIPINVVQTVYLNMNYRSSGPIVEICNILFNKSTNNNDDTTTMKSSSGNREGSKVKILECDDSLSEAQYITQQINTLVNNLENGISFRDIAILYRCHSIGQNIKNLLPSSLPIQILNSGLQANDNKENKDINIFINMLKIINNNNSPLSVFQQILLKSNQQKHNSILMDIFQQAYEIKEQRNATLHIQITSLESLQIANRIIGNKLASKSSNKRKRNGNIVALPFIELWYQTISLLTSTTWKNVPTPIEEIVGLIAKLCLATSRGVKHLEIYYSYLQSYCAETSRDTEINHRSSKLDTSMERNIFQESSYLATALKLELIQWKSTDTNNSTSSRNTENTAANNIDETSPSGGNIMNNLQLFLSYLMESYSEDRNIYDSNNYLMDTFHYNNEESMSTTANAVWMSTVHQAKGLEWKTVFLIQVNDDQFPLFGGQETINNNSETAMYEDEYNPITSDEAEEKRLLYVGVSRAKQYLHISYHSERKDTVGISRYLLPVLRSSQIERIQVHTQKNILENKSPILSTNALSYNNQVNQTRDSCILENDLRIPHLTVKSTINSSLPIASINIATQLPMSSNFEQVNNSCKWVPELNTQDMKADRLTSSNASESHKITDCSNNRDIFENSGFDDNTKNVKCNLAFSSISSPIKNRNYGVNDTPCFMTYSRKK